MKDKALHMHRKEVDRLSPIELIKVHGGRAHKAGGMAARGADSMIAVIKERVTYTFIMNKEVASIHFDRARKQIFFSGHNIENLKLTEEQRAELMKFSEVLAADQDGRELKSDYDATLGMRLADNK